MSNIGTFTLGHTAFLILSYTFPKLIAYSKRVQVLRISTKYFVVSICATVLLSLTVASEQLNKV
jgi:hypothetical protein